MFERHVGIETSKYKLNKYSSNPDQLEKWIDAFFVAQDSCGAVNRPPTSIEEKDSLNSLIRGVFAKKTIKKNEVLTRENVFFAMPFIEGNMSVKRITSSKTFFGSGRNYGTLSRLNTSRVDWSSQATRF